MCDRRSQFLNPLLYQSSTNEETVAIMATITAHFSSSFISYSSPKFHSSYSFPSTTTRFTCSASKTPTQHNDRMSFMNFPYVSTSHKDLMVDLVSTVENRLDSFLNPCTLPPDIQSYQNDTGTAHAALHLRSGVQSSPVCFRFSTLL